MVLFCRYRNNTLLTSGLTESTRFSNQIIAEQNSCHILHRTLYGIAAVLDCSFAGHHTVDADGIHGVLDRGQGDIADGIGILCYCGKHCAVGGQLLAILAGILGIGDGLEAVAGAGILFTADQDDLTVAAAYILPVGDLTFVNAGDLLQCQICNGVAGIYDYCDAVDGNHSFLQTLSLFGVL